MGSWGHADLQTYLNSLVERNMIGDWSRHIDSGLYQIRVKDPYEPEYTGLSLHEAKDVYAKVFMENIDAFNQEMHNNLGEPNPACSN